VICPTGPGKVITRITFLWTKWKRVNGARVGQLYGIFSSGIPQTEDPLFFCKMVFFAILLFLYSE
jgi:hypothetical protein